MTKPLDSTDPVRQAASLACKQLQDLAALLHDKLKGPAGVPAGVVAGLLIDAGRMGDRLQRHLDRTTGE